MDCNDVKEGLKVRISKLQPTDGMIIAHRHLRCRSKGITGTVKHYVPGHGGDVWFVGHDGSDDIGAYCFTELEIA